MNIQETLLTPPTSPSPSPSGFPSDRTHLRQRRNSAISAHLDTLLESYLEHLHTYQRLRAELSENLASGFFSLAHANHVGNRGSGRRYGEEGYDGRMKAGRRVEIGVHGLGSDRETEHREGKEKREQGSKEGIGNNEYHHQPTQDNNNNNDIIYHIKAPLATIESSSSSTCSSLNGNASIPFGSTSTTSSDPALPSTDSPPAAKYSDPRRWYGILTPPTLRVAQSSFSTALDKQVAQLINVRMRMVELEETVQRWRDLMRR